MIKTIYKVISGSSSEIEHVLNFLAKENWRPVAMSSHGQPAALAVILENKIMEEARPTLSDAILDSAGNTAEEIQ